MNLRTTVMNCKKIIPLFFIVPFLLLTGRGFAQDSARKISLEEAIDLSIKNNKPLRASQARVDQAAADTTISKQNQLPDLKVSGSYLRLTQPNIIWLNRATAGHTQRGP